MRKITALISLILLTVMCGICFTGCNDSVSKKEETTLEPLDTPTVIAVGNTIYWDVVTDADEYEIYQDNTLCKSIKETYCVFDNLTANSSFYVIAKNSNGRISEKSEQVVLYKNTDFAETEIMSIDLTDGNAYTIPSNAAYVKVQGSAVNAFIAIADRNSDLIIELNSVVLTSPEGKNCISTVDGTFDSESKHYAVTVVVNGENTLTGSNFTTVPDAPKNDSGSKGTKGGSGGSCIVAPNLAITGSGILVLDAGDGGKGGVGAASTTWSTSSFGEGGNGGDGGNGISCTRLVLAMDIGGMIKSYGGNAGAGGNAGENGSIITGPTASALDLWNKSRGTDGTPGSSYVGDTKIFGGALIDY